MPRRLVLVPSPLLATDSWAPTATALMGRGHDVAIARLEDGPAPLWRRHAESAAGAVGDAISYVLVGHSGSGPLLPAIATAVGRPAEAAIFVDAGLPLDGTTRLEQIGVDSPATAVALRETLDAGGSYPAWRDEDLEGLIPDATARRRLLEGVRPRDSAFFDEPIWVDVGWLHTPAGYVRLSSAYDVWARIAADRGWPVERLDGGHFQILTEPDRVAMAIENALATLLTDEPTAQVAPVELRFDDRGLIPAIVQQHDTGEVLMMAWMSAETLAETMERRETVFWSRSRAQRWHKGATSGNTQRVVDIVADCDGDVLLIKVDQGGAGVACHTGKRTCFHVPLTNG